MVFLRLLMLSCGYVNPGVLPLGMLSDVGPAETARLLGGRDGLYQRSKNSRVSESSGHNWARLDGTEAVSEGETQ